MPLPPCHLRCHLLEAIFSMCNSLAHAPRRDGSVPLDVIPSMPSLRCRHLDDLSFSSMPSCRCHLLENIFSMSLLDAISSMSSSRFICLPYDLWIPAREYIGAARWLMHLAGTARHPSMPLPPCHLRCHLLETIFSMSLLDAILSIVFSIDLFNLLIG